MKSLVERNPAKPVELTCLHCGWTFIRTIEVPGPLCSGCERERLLGH